MKQCPNGHEVGDNVKYCPTCGTEIISGNKFCTKCGNERKGAEKFCPKCGTPFDSVSSHNHTVFNEGKRSSFKKCLPYIIGTLVLLVIIGAFASRGSNGSDSSQSVVADSIAVEDTKKTSERDIKLITEWYDYVFGKKEISDDVLDKFLSSKVKKSLWTEDYDGCYEFWQFRTIAQDYNPNVGDISKIENISVNSDGWYEVKYLDMGNKGKTTIKIDNTKIVDFVPDSSWSNNESSVGNRADNETIADENSDNSSSAYNSSTTSSSSSRTFYSEQIVIGYLANQSFRCSDGLTMRVDGSGRLYVDGDYAGVLSVLRYNSTSALLRFGGGMYGEGKLTVNIVGDKFTLTDPTDGTVYYQR